MSKLKVYDNLLSQSVIAGRPHYLLSPKTVHEFLGYGNPIRKIPDYQRPYSWSNKNIEALLFDILNLVSDENASWFLGPVFSTKVSENDEVSHLLDGQQRITTLQILLRECSMIKIMHESVDWNSNKNLEVKINQIISNCEYCLIQQGFPAESRFKTEESIDTLFERYILDIVNIKSYEDYKYNQREIFDQLELKLSEGSKTAGNVKTAVQTVNKFLLKNIYEKDVDVVENLNLFCDFISALLTKCWLIEIPLQEDDYSIKIFESINNRGKSLTLVDKLRYKSLINCSDNIREEVKKKWKSVYIGLEQLEESRFIKTEDDFFKVFFNSVKGDDFTSELDIIELFQKEYLSSDQDVLFFLEQVRKILEFHKYINNALDRKNVYLEKHFKGVERNKVAALFQLFRNTLKISDNSRFLFYHLIQKNDLNTDTIEIIKGIWAIVRLVFFEELLESRKSNAVRVDFLKKISESHNKSLSFSHIISNEPKYIVTKKSILNILKSNDNDEARFILYLWNYLMDFEALIAMAPTQYDTSDLEHMFPRAWKPFWQDKIYSKNDILAAILVVKEEDIPNINMELLKSELQSLEEVELKDTSSVQPNSVIEFIGNKWVLHGGTNKKIKNSIFSEKKVEFQKDKYVKLPTNQNTRIGMNIYSDFSAADVVQRSLFIIDDILAKFHNEWDEVVSR